MKDLGLEVETLEKSLHVSSPLGTRVNIDKICRGCELDILRILLTMDLRVMDMSKFDVMDKLTTHRVAIIVIVGGLLPTHRMMVVLCFKGISTILYPKPFMTLDSTGS